MRNVLYPKFAIALLPRIIGIAVIGALIAGCYGIIHDQFTYTLSEEYFTKLKFHQFYYANFGFPRRVFVGEVGFLATWWVGLFAGWFIARTALPRMGREQVPRHCAMAFLIMFVIAALGTMTGYLLGRMHGPDYSSWAAVTFRLNIEDVASFVRVAYIHNCSYAGGAVGLIAAVIYLRRVAPVSQNVTEKVHY